LPAPGQGAIAIVCREDDKSVLGKIAAVNDPTTMICVNAERGFLHELKGGCSAPISAYAIVSGSDLNFEGAVHSLDGKHNFRVTKTFGKSDFSNAGGYSADEVLKSPEGRSILEAIFREKPELGA
jgi:hydroxymethylbilane synthase